MAEHGGAKKKPTGDYETGYCKPPKATQFTKENWRGNRNGRPKKAIDFDASLDNMLQKKVTVPIDGKIVKLPMADVIAFKIGSSAAKGDRHCQKLLIDLSLRRKSLIQADDEDLDEDHEGIADRALERRYLKKKQDE